MPLFMRRLHFVCGPKLAVFRTFTPFIRVEGRVESVSPAMGNPFRLFCGLCCAAETAALHFAWRVAKHVKSNAIVYAKDGITAGIGAGQMNRRDSARIAAING